jgi:hypothetical protein
MPTPPIVDVRTARLNEARERGIPGRNGGRTSANAVGTVRGTQRQRGRVEPLLARAVASRAYRWGEDGLGGICDDKQRLLPLAL